MRRRGLHRIVGVVGFAVVVAGGLGVGVFQEQGGGSGGGDGGEGDVVVAFVPLVLEGWCAAGGEGFQGIVVAQIYRDGFRGPEGEMNPLDLVFGAAGIVGIKAAVQVVFKRACGAYIQDAACLLQRPRLP